MSALEESFEQVIAAAVDEPTDNSTSYIVYLIASRMPFERLVELGYRNRQARKAEER